MKHFVVCSVVAAFAMALAAMPVCAQGRGGGGGGARGGGGGSYGGGGGRSSSMSASRGGGGSYGGSMSRGSSYSYGSSSRSSSYSSQQRGGYSSGYTRSGSSDSQTSRGGAYSSQQRSSYSSYPQTRASGSQTRTYGSQTQSYGSQTRSSESQPQRSYQGSGSSRGYVSNTGRPTPSGSYNPSGGQPTRVVLSNHSYGRVSPRYCDPMPFNRPVPFWGHGCHFFGYPVHYLPGRYVVHRYWGYDYYIIDGLYYRYYGDCYYVCRPPFGVFFDPILDGVALVACNIAYYASTYNSFRTINENANTITEQNRIIAQNNATIAQQNNQIALNSERAAAAQLAADKAGLVQSYADVSTEYFYDDGIFFTKGKDGKYVTIVPPAGALVKELPEDYDVITLEGKEYYKVDDTVYTTSVVNGTLYFEVLGQMTGELAERFDFNRK